MSARAAADKDSMRLVPRQPHQLYDGRILAVVTLAAWLVLMLLLAGGAGAQG
jgi:hypothetical protein